MSGTKYKLIHKVLFILIFVTVGLSSILAESNADNHKSEKERLDSLEKDLPALEKKVISTLMFGGSSLISFTGEARVKCQYHIVPDYPDYLTYDKSRTQVFGGVRLGMVVQPGRNLTLWSKLGFTSKLPGHALRTFESDSSGKYGEIGGHHYWNNKPVSIFEDMCAGVAIRTEPASFWLKLGSIIWTEASPFTIWKAQPRNFAWDYLEYEEEQPASEYFESTVAQGEKTGRSAWHKKAFNGINLESIELPLDIYANVLLARFPQY